MGLLARHGAASLVDEAVADLLDGGDVWVQQINAPEQAGLVAHDVYCQPEAAAALRDRWRVTLRRVVAETPELHGWQVLVTVRPEMAEDYSDTDQAAIALPERSSTAVVDDQEARLRYRRSLLQAAEYCALPHEYLSPAALDEQLEVAELSVAQGQDKLLAGCLVHAADMVTDGLFDDIVALRAHDPRSGQLNVDHLAVLSLLPPRFAHRYTALFAQKFLVVLTDMTRRITAGWDPLGCVAQQLAVHVWLDHVDSIAELAEIELEQDWRGHLEQYLFEDTDHELLYVQALDGFEDDADLDHLGMAPMRWEDWFVPFTDCTLPVYAMDRG